MIDLFLTGLLLSFAISIFIFSRSHEIYIVDKALSSLLPLLLYLNLAVLAGVLMSEPYYNAWTSSRLTPTLAFFKNITIYSTNQQGPVQISLYPPGWFLSFAPVIFLKSPTGVMMMGLLLTQVYTFLPVLVLLKVASSNTRITLIVFSLFVFSVINTPALKYSCFLPHADAPALGLALLAFIFFQIHLKRHSGENGLWLLLSLISGWLAVWTKQVMIPVIPGLLVCMFLARGRRSFLIYTGWSIGVGVVVSALFLALFPAEGVLFNIVTIPFRTPWRGLFPYNLGYAVQEIMQHSSVYLLAMLFGAILICNSRNGSGKFKWLITRDWFLLVIIAIFHVTTSVLGRVKIGGDINTFSPALYFLAAGLCVQITDIYGLMSSPENTKDPAYQSYKYFLLISVSFIVCLWGFNTLSQYRGIHISRIRTNPAQTAFDYLKKVDPHVYFPTLPLAHLMANKKMYNHSNSIYEREKLVGFLLSGEQKEKYFPSEPTMVCWQDEWGAEYVRSKYFLDYNVPVKNARLYCFDCYRWE